MALRTGGDEFDAAPGRGELLAIAAAVAFSFFIGMFLALRAGPWRWADEHAHTGYLMALVEGDLPTLDTPIAVPSGAGEMEIVLALARPLEDGSNPRRQVWVANHPPGPYLPAVPGAWLAARGDDGSQVLLWQRFANVLGGSLVVGFAGLLGHQLSGRWSVGAAVAGLTALSPHLAGTTASGLTDGPGTAALVAAVWATVRALRRGFDARSTAVVAVALSVCGLTRISSLAAAATGALLALVLHAVANRRWPWRQALIIFGSVAVSSGWFYARTTARYGDPAASSELMTRMGRSPNGSWWSVLTSASTWGDPVRKLLTTFRGEPITVITPDAAPERASVFMLALITAAVLVIAVDAWRHRRSPAASRMLTGDRARGWAVAGAALVVVVATTARHIAAGGLPHARYLLLVLPLVACVVAIAAATLSERLPRARVLAVAPTAALAVFFVLRLSSELSRYAHRAPLRAHLGGSIAQAVAVSIAAVALVTHVVLLRRIRTPAVR